MKTNKKYLSLLLTAALLVGLCAGFAPAARAAGVDITDKFTDANFKAAVYEVIGKSAPAPILESDVAGVTELDIPWLFIKNLAGLEYFTGLTVLSCYGNPLMSLPALPSSLTVLKCWNNGLTELPPLPAGLQQLACENNPLGELPALPSGLRDLSCANNNLTSLPELPDSLTYLFCARNQLTSLPSLPHNLGWLYCNNNQLTELSALPAGLQELFCSRNLLTEIDVSGLDQLERLNCAYNNMADETAVKGFSGTWGEYMTGDWAGRPFVFHPQTASFPALSGLSSWAVNEAGSLNARSVIPDALRNDFRKPIRRDEFTALLFNILEYVKGPVILYGDKSPFTDISDSDYAYEIQMARSQGLVDGTSPTKFTPAGLLTREQTAKLLYTMVAAIDGAAPDLDAAPSFTDNAAISDWARPYVAWCQKNNVMQGTATGKFDPLGNLTREQAMLVCERLIVQFGW